MKFFVLKFWTGLRDWTLKWSHSPHMAAGLFFIALVEAVFFPIPPDVLLIAILLINVERWWFYAAVTAAGSVVGSILAYAIGYGFYETVGIKIVQFYGIQELVQRIGLQFQGHAFLAVLASALTPIPFKVVNLAAGLFHISIWALIAAAVVGRTIRYFAVAYIIKYFGKTLNNFVYKYFNILTVIFFVVLLLGFYIMKFIF
jgi:membrane protein YqaA with SNARE-associated domain